MESILARFVALWTRARLDPADAGARLREGTAPVCYVLERYSAVDFAVLHSLCKNAKLPRPRRRLLPEKAPAVRAAFALERPVGFWRTRLDRRSPKELTVLIDALRADPELDVALVPVGMYWGRAPQKERSLIRLMLSEDWAFGSRLRRAFSVLVNGRNVWVQLGDPISLRSLLGGEADTASAARRVTRALKMQLARARAARIGPDLSHRRTIVAEVLRSRAVRQAVAQMAKEKPGTTRRDALLEARRCIDEIAANYSHRFVSVVSHFLPKLWNRLYEGIEFTHLDTLRQVADGNEVVYVPCHRSHMDYLLLSNSIYQHGFAIPHVAAGVNLNLPVVGRFLRKGGGFFMRRSFRGYSLYTVVFSQYLAAIMARGHPLEYFIEGGRSRSGRLLEPATGMLSMTVRSFLRQPRRPVVFLPVYFGYERIWEGATYIGELSGRPKEKENIGTLLKSLYRLRERFGRVHINLGEPIFLNEMLERHAPDWRRYTGHASERPRGITLMVGELAATIMRHINSAASVTPVNLLALTLLATPRQMALSSELEQHIETLLAVLRAAPYSDRVTLTALTPAEIVEYGVKLQMITRETHRAGEFVRMSPEHAVLATYYRNNVLHLVALPSLVACCFIANTELSTADIQRFARRIYPYIAAELTLRWREDEVAGVINGVLSALARCGLLEAAPGECWRRPAPSTAAATELSLLAQATVQTIERYYLAIALLARAGSGEISPKALEEQCQQMAQRMTLLYGLNSPEFFDRALFGSFISLLRSRGVLKVNAGGCLTFDEVLIAVARDAEIVLSEQIRHSILQVTHG